jgi:hypothetical protein
MTRPAAHNQILLSEIDRLRAELATQRNALSQATAQINAVLALCTTISNGRPDTAFLPVVAIYAALERTPNGDRLTPSRH